MRREHGVRPTAPEEHAVKPAFSNTTLRINEPHVSRYLEGMELVCMEQRCLLARPQLTAALERSIVNSTSLWPQVQHFPIGFVSKHV